jgi:hypothetical protein
MHDPMQTYATSGGYPGVTPFGLPYGALQTSGINPTLANPFAQVTGISPAYSGYPTHPGQLGATSGWQNPLWQNPLIAQAIQNPLLFAGLQNPMLNNPMLQNPVLQNPFLQHSVLQNPFVNPIQAQLQAHAQQLALQLYAAHAGGASLYGAGSPYGQMGSPFTQPGLFQGGGISPLAPQTWVGQGGGIGYGQGQSIQPHALAQLVGRGFQGFQTPGISPWVGL